MAKAIGLIHTPIIIEAIPYLTGLAIVLSGLKQIGSFIHEVKNGLDELKNLSKRVENIHSNLGIIKVDIHNLDKRLVIVESKI